MINVRDYGASGNGTSNDTAAFNAAVAATPAGGTLYIPVGTYLLDPITINKTIHLTLDAGATLKQNSTTVNTGLITFAGALSGTSTTTAGSSVTAGDLSVQVSSLTGFGVGDWVVIEDTSAVSTDFEYEYQKLAGVASGTLYLAAVLEVPVTYATTVTTVTKVNGLTGIRVTGGTWDGNAMGAAGASLLQFDYCYDVQVVDATFTNWDFTALEARHSKHLTVNGCKFLDASGDLSPSGSEAGNCLNPRLGTAHTVVTNCLFRRLQHAVTVSEGAHTVSVTNCAFHGCFSSPLDTHFRRQLNVVFSSNVITGDTWRSPTDLDRGDNVGYGISVSTSDTRVVISNNVISYTRGAGIYVSKDDPDESYVTISGNVLTDCYCAGEEGEDQGSIYLDSVRNVSVTGNAVKRTDTVKVAGIAVFRSERLTISSNTVIFENGSANGNQGIYLEDCSKSTIVGNVVKHSSTDGVAFRVRNSDTAEVVGNVSELGSGTHFHTDGSTAVNELANSWNNSATSRPNTLVGDISALGGYRQTIGGFGQAGVTASQSDVDLANKKPWIAPRGGSITGVAVRSTQARTAGTLTIKVTKNTSAVGSLTAVLNATNTTAKATTQNMNAASYDFAAGDAISLSVTTDGSWATGAAADISATLEIET